MNYKWKWSNKGYHFFFFLGFLIFMLASGMGILSPSSAGSVILLMFLIMFTVFLPSLFSYAFTASIFSSVMLGVKFIIIVFSAAGFRPLICSRKWSLSLYRLFAYKNYKFGHFFTSWNNWSDTLVRPPTFNVLSWV